MNVTVTMNFDSVEDAAVYMAMLQPSTRSVPVANAEQVAVEKPPVTPAEAAFGKAAFGKAISAIATVSDTVVAKRRPGRPPKAQVHGAQTQVASNSVSSEPVCQDILPDAPLAGVAAVAAVPAEEPSTVPSDPVVEPSAGGDVTIDAVRNALAAVNSAKGLEAARTVLKEFDAGRISDVKESDYPAFIARCQEAAK